VTDKGPSSSRKEEPASQIVQQPAAQIALLPEGYGEFLAALKAEIRTAQIKAALSVNRELILLYWRIGHQIAEKQKQENWGKKVIDHLAVDLKLAFPEMRGFSPRNILYM
jgi:hypothetical protein